MCVSVHLSAGIYMLWSKCGDQGATCRSQLLLPTSSEAGFLFGSCCSLLPRVLGNSLVSASLYNQHVGIPEAHHGFWLFYVGFGN